MLRMLRMVTTTDTYLRNNYSHPWSSNHSPNSDSLDGHKWHRHWRFYSSHSLPCFISMTNGVWSILGLRWSNVDCLLSYLNHLSNAVHRRSHLRRTNCIRKGCCKFTVHTQRLSFGICQPDLIYFSLFDCCSKSGQQLRGTKSRAKRKRTERPDISLLPSSPWTWMSFTFRAKVICGLLPLQSPGK